MPCVSQLNSLDRDHKGHKAEGNLEQDLVTVTSSVTSDVLFESSENILEAPSWG